MSLFDYIKYSHINENSSFDELEDLPDPVINEWLKRIRKKPDTLYSTGSMNILREVLLEYEGEAHPTIHHSVIIE